VGPLRFIIKNYDKPLRSGDIIYIRMYNFHLEDVLRIPVNSVSYSHETGDYVYVMVNGRKEMRQVEVGAMRSSTMVEIISGLEEGDEIYVRQ